MLIEQIRGVWVSKIAAGRAERFAASTPESHGQHRDYPHGWKCEGNELGLLHGHCQILNIFCISGIIQNKICPACRNHSETG